MGVGNGGVDVGDVDIGGGVRDAGVAVGDGIAVDIRCGGGGTDDDMGCCCC